MLYMYHIIYCYDICKLSHTICHITPQHVTCIPYSIIYCHLIPFLSYHSKSHPKSFITQKHEMTYRTIFIPLYNTLHNTVHKILILFRSNRISNHITALKRSEGEIHCKQNYGHVYMFIKVSGRRKVSYGHTS